MENKKMTMTELAYKLALTSKKLSNNIISFTDDKGEIRVDTDTGVFARVTTDGKLRQYMSGELSTSDKPYGVIQVYVDGKAKTLRQHTMMAMLTHRDKYKPGLIVGHRDSVKWHNTPDNLEWITNKQNSEMAELLRKLEERYPGRYTYYTFSLSLNQYLASRYRIDHKDIDKILAVIDNSDAVDDYMNYV